MLTVKVTDAYGASTVSLPVYITVKCSRNDLNNDNIADVNDYLKFVAAFGNPCSNCPEDFNTDGTVDVNDYLLFVAKFGYSCN